MSAEKEGGLWRPAEAAEGDRFQKDWCRHCLNRHGDGKWEDEFGNDITGWCIASESVHWRSPEPSICRRDNALWCASFCEDHTNPAPCLFTLEMNL